MTKPIEQNETPEDEAREPRKLNMEEKRKLEKLLIADIDSAASRYDAVTQAERDALVDKLVRQPSPEAKKLYERYKLAVKQQADIEEELDALGYDITYPDELAVNGSGNKPKQFIEFDGRADEMRRKLAAIKRSYIIKLFADHADTQSLFGSLSQDLEQLVG